MPAMRLDDLPLERFGSLRDPQSHRNLRQELREQIRFVRAQSAAIERRHLQHAEQRTARHERGTKYTRFTRSRLLRRGPMVIHKFHQIQGLAAAPLAPTADLTFEAMHNVALYETEQRIG